MKVFPIDKIKQRPNADEFRDLVPGIQANMDGNEGLAAFDFRVESVSEPVAVVGYGPSLRRTWEQLRDYRHVWTVSGAHDFLVERGIVPALHTDVDWRAAGPKEQHRSVRYVLANSVRTEYAHAMVGAEMFQPWGENSAEWYRAGSYAKVFMPGDTALTAIVLADASGFRDIHTFGIDGSHDFDGQIREHASSEVATHAGSHARPRRDTVYVTDEQYNLYETSHTLILACMAFGKVLERVSEDTAITVVSDGLLPAWIEMERSRKNG